MEHDHGLLTTPPICEVCGKDLCGTHSYDVWISRTTYNDKGEPIKVGMQVEIPDDYVVVGALCCGRKVLSRWTEFVNELKKEGDK